MKSVRFLSLSVITCMLALFVTSCLDGNGNRRNGSCYAVAGTNSLYLPVLHTRGWGDLSCNGIDKFVAGECYVIAFEINYDEQPADASSKGYYFATVSGSEKVKNYGSIDRISGELEPRDKEQLISSVAIADLVQNQLFLEVYSTQVEKQTTTYELYYHPDSVTVDPSSGNIYNLYLMATGDKEGDGTNQVGERTAFSIADFWRWATEQEKENALINVRIKFAKSIDTSVTPAKIEWTESSAVSIANDKKNE